MELVKFASETDDPTFFFWTGGDASVANIASAQTDLGHEPALICIRPNQEQPGDPASSLLMSNSNLSAFPKSNVQMKYSASFQPGKIFLDQINR
ncbi:hypothetical protein PsorP6_012411 [Peronosclerospora sorghi]|uniref:Uncharacterized protein n=1 Tax=Peronosclerospora sorghi TaxID=230839 RepID=A0ACC0WEI4_9STRA|nr:hypothetical protein PsorP6_012411 [Peronosclerospora sorghi]